MRAFRNTLLVGAVMIGGCAANTPAPSESSSGATEIATEIDPATTQPSYWLDLAALSVSSDDFDRLWHVSKDTALDFGFKIDRSDYRGGVMTTVPLTSAQWFEFWRSDVRSFENLEESSIATIRRTIRFEFARDESSGMYKCFPKVLVERQAIAEQRITSVVSYQSINRRPLKVRDRPSGTRESDEGLLLPSRYWYLIGRDQSLETALIDALKKKLAQVHSS